MGSGDRLKKIKEAAEARLKDESIRKGLADAVTGAASALEGAEAVAQRSGLTKRSGEVSKFKVAKAALKPGKTARTLLQATAEEIRDRRTTDASSPEADPQG
jgi:hypothetical protein